MFPGAGKVPRVALGRAGGVGGVSPVTGSIRETSWRRRHPKRPCKCILRDLGGLITGAGAGWVPGRLTWYSLTDFFFFVKCIYLAVGR